MTQPKGSFEETAATTIASLRTWLMIVTVAVVITLGLSIAGFGSSVSNEQTTCQIQDRGLLAQQHLVDFLTYLDELAIQPSQQAQREHQPLAVQRLDSEAVASLNAYVAVTHRQPRSRSC